MLHIWEGFLNFGFVEVFFLFIFWFNFPNFSWTLKHIKMCQSLSNHSSTFYSFAQTGNCFALNIFTILIDRKVSLWLSIRMSVTFKDKQNDDLIFRFCLILDAMCFEFCLWKVNNDLFCEKLLKNLLWN